MNPTRSLAGMAQILSAARAGVCRPGPETRCRSLTGTTREYAPPTLGLPIHYFGVSPAEDGERVVETRVPGGHFTMFEPPHVATLGAAFATALRENVPPTPAPPSPSSSATACCWLS